MTTGNADVQTFGTGVSPVAHGQDRPLVINRRPVTWFEAEGNHYAYYDAPVYRDKIYIETKLFKFDMNLFNQAVAPPQPGVNPNEAKPPVSSADAIEINSRNYLVVLRALASWTREEPLSEDAIENLPIGLADTIESKILAVKEWANLGEAQSRQG